MSRAAGEADRSGDRRSARSARRLAGGESRRISLEPGDPPADLRRLAVRRCRRSLMYAVFVLRPLALTVQYSLYRWDGIGPATWVGLDELRQRS